MVIKGWSGEITMAEVIRLAKQRMKKKEPQIVFEVSDAGLNVIAPIYDTTESPSWLRTLKPLRYATLKVNIDSHPDEEFSGSWVARISASSHEESVQQAKQVAALLKFPSFLLLARKSGYEYYWAGPAAMKR